jgi:hypothetical protein
VTGVTIPDRPGGGQRIVPGGGRRPVAEPVDVEILGHGFEQSISDPEELHLAVAEAT